jgi:hypothetical protein
LGHRWTAGRSPRSLDARRRARARRAALRAGPHELTGTMLRDARATRLRLAAWRLVCVSPAEGWRGERPLSWGGWARTLVGAYGLTPRLPEETGTEQRIEGEDYESASAGGGLTRRRLGDAASRGGWATASTSPAEFTWRLRLEQPGVVTLLARTHGAPEQLWSIDGRYRVTVEPEAREGGFAWSPVATPAPAGGTHPRARRAGLGGRRPARDPSPLDRRRPPPGRSGARAAGGSAGLSRAARGRAAVAAAPPRPRAGGGAPAAPRRRPRTQIGGGPRRERFRTRLRPASPSRSCPPEL